MGLVLGGLLAPTSWRLVFLVSVPFGLFGTVWAYWKLEERGERRPARIDWWGNATFAIGLILVLVSITYGIQPYGGHSMGWTNPLVLAEMGSGLAAARDLRRGRAAHGRSHVQPRPVPDPGLHGRQHRHPARIARPRRADVHADHLAAGHLAAAARLQLAETPLWAGIYMLPLTVGFLIAGPASGRLSDRFGARPFATGGMVAAALAFLLLELLPVDFAYWAFASLLLLMGLAMGLFSAPNQMGIMNSLPAHRRGVGSGMAATFQNSAMVLSIGIFFSLMIVGLSASLPGAMDRAWSRRASRRPTQRASPICPRWACCSPRSWATTPWSTCSGRRCIRSPPATPPI